MGGGESAPRPSYLYTLERLGTHRTGGWVGQSGRAENHVPHRDSIPDHQARSLSLY